MSARESEIHVAAAAARTTFDLPSTNTNTMHRTNVLSMYISSRTIYTNKIMIIIGRKAS